MGNYIDISYIEDALNTEFSSTTNPTETQMEDYIDIAEEQFENEVGNFRLSDNVEYKDGTKSGYLFLDKKPINSITSVEINNGDIFSPDYEELETDEYAIVDSSIGQIALSSSSRGKLKYKVTYNSGYSAETMPKQIQYCVYLMTMRLAFQKTLFTDYGSTYGVTETIDVGVYKEVTKGGSAYKGTVDIDNLINGVKGNIGTKFNTYLY